MTAPCELKLYFTVDALNRSISRTTYFTIIERSPTMIRAITTRPIVIGIKTIPKIIFALSYTLIVGCIAIAVGHYSRVWFVGNYTFAWF